MSNHHRRYLPDFVVVLDIEVVEMRVLQLQIAASIVHILSVQSVTRFFRVPRSLVLDQSLKTQKIGDSHSVQTSGQRSRGMYPDKWAKVGKNTVGMMP